MGLLITAKSLFIILSVISLMAVGFWIAARSGVDLARPSERVRKTADNFWQAVLVLAGYVVGLAAVQQFIGVRLSLPW